MRGWTISAAEAAVMVALLMGCAADDGDLGPDDGDVLLPVEDGGACPPGELRGLLGCEPLPADVCGAVDALDLPGADRDGDCFVDADGEPAVADCDDTRADVFPGAEELCDGIDNDCDGVPDEGFAVGGACMACGRDGKLECAVGDPRAVACTTAAGQSAGPPPTPEICDGEDDDCDGEIDEACRMDLPPVARSQPALCEDAVLVVEAGALVRVPLDGGAPSTLDPGPVAAPGCAGGVIAWLRVDAATCEAPAEGPGRCPRAQVVYTVGAEPPQAVGLGAHGAPVVTEEAIFWHTVLDDGPVVQRLELGGEAGIAPLFAGAAASDPTRPVAGAIAVRLWDGARPRIELRGLEEGVADVRLDTASVAAGPPALGARWAAWVLEGEGGAVWAVPVARPRDGFQVTAEAGPRGRPWLVEDRLYWVDADGLRRFDLETGEARRVIPTPVRAADVAIGGGRVAWIDGEHLYLAVED